MNKHIHNRTLLLAALRRELVGPDPVPGSKPLDVQQPPVFKNFQEKRGPWVDARTGQEIISQDTPTKRYGVGVLHPVPEGRAASHASPQEQQDERRDEALLDQEHLPSLEVAEAPEGTLDPEGNRAAVRELEAVLERVERARSHPGFESDPEEAFDVSGANGFRPSAIAISFLAELPDAAVLRVTLPPVLPPDHAFAGMAVNGRYRKVAVKRQGKAKPAEVADQPTEAAPEGQRGDAAAQASLPEVAASAPAPEEGAEGASVAAAKVGDMVNDTLWVREQVEAEYEVSARDLLASQGRFLKLQPIRASGTEGLRLSLEILARPVASADPGGVPRRLITVNLVNRSGGDELADQYCLFQSFFEARFEVGGEVSPTVLPYPRPLRDDFEERSNALLYRNTPTFATGHGCASDWLAATSERAATLRAECLPVHEVPSITPDIERRVFNAGQERLERIEVPMRGLAGLEPA